MACISNYSRRVLLCHQRVNIPCPLSSLSRWLWFLIVLLKVSAYCVSDKARKKGYEKILAKSIWITSCFLNVGRPSSLHGVFLCLSHPLLRLLLGDNPCPLVGGSSTYYDTENVKLSVKILLFSCILCYTGLWWRHGNQVLRSSLNGCGQHWFWSEKYTWSYKKGPETAVWWLTTLSS